LQCAKQYVFSKPHQAYTITRAFEELEDIHICIMLASPDLHYHLCFWRAWEYTINYVFS